MNPPDQQNPQSQQPSYQQNIIIVGKQKSVGVAFILAFFFGPLGLLYSSVVGGIVMFFIGIIIAFITLGFGLIIVWIGCIIWAIVAANNANSKIASSISTNINLGNAGNVQQPYTPTPAGVPLQSNVKAPVAPPTLPANDIPPYEKNIAEPQIPKQPESVVAPAATIPPNSQITNNPLANKRYLLIAAIVLGVVIIAGGIYIFKLKRELAGRRSFFSAGAVADSAKLADSAKAVDSAKAGGIDNKKNDSITAINAYNSATHLQNGVFGGNNFQVTVPTDFVVKPSIRSKNAGYLSAFFESPDSLVEFYFFQSNYNDQAPDIIVNSTIEKLTSTSVQKSNKAIITWYEISALDNSYLRAYQDVESSAKDLHWIVGLKYKSKAAYDQYKSAYLKFKSSYKELSGD